MTGNKVSMWVDYNYWKMEKERLLSQINGEEAFTMIVVQINVEMLHSP